ncbi:10225_t:CDS:1, partial [Ambispora leptoticha]
MTETFQLLSHVSAFPPSAMAKYTSLLGFCYQYGIGAPYLYGKAFELYNDAAGLGDGFALTQVGMCFRLGSGISCDHDSAIKYYEKAAIAGHPQGMYKYAGYQRGRKQAL